MHRIWEQDLGTGAVPRIWGQSRAWGQDRGYAQDLGTGIVPWIWGQDTAVHRIWGHAHKGTQADAAQVGGDRAGQDRSGRPCGVPGGVPSLTCSSTLVTEARCACVTAQAASAAAQGCL